LKEANFSVEKLEARYECYPDSKLIAELARQLPELARKSAALPRPELQASLMLLASETLSKFDGSTGPPTPPTQQQPSAPHHQPPVAEAHPTPSQATTETASVMNESMLASLTGCFRPAIKKFFETHRSFINQANNTHGLGARQCCNFGGLKTKKSFVRSRGTKNNRPLSGFQTGEFIRFSNQRRILHLNRRADLFLQRSRRANANDNRFASRPAGTRSRAGLVPAPLHNTTWNWC
jgi:hypothetical protein